ncbi:23215_t:CDS:2, partial [Racocetra persica]
VIIEQNTPLNIQTIENLLTAFDLPILLAFGIFMAAVQDPKKLAEKLDLPNKTTRKDKQPYSESAQEESSSQAKRLRTAATNINKAELTPILQLNTPTILPITFSQWILSSSLKRLLR